MRALIVLLPLLLAACAQTGRPEAGRPSSVPERSALKPGAARLVAAAEREWRDWGRLSVEGWPVALDRVPDATPDLFERLMTYWSATPEGPEVTVAHRHFRDTISAPMVETASLDPVSGLPFEVRPANVSMTTFNHPAWSAAFISHVMTEAGFPRGEFDPSASHAFYVDRMLENAMAQGDAAAFRPHALAAHVPRPGDVLCADRAATPLADWSERVSEIGRFRPMHCDIVVQSGRGHVEIIGGNVLDVVLRRRIPTDAAGHILQAPEDRAPFFVVFENRR